MRVLGEEFFGKEITLPRLQLSYRVQNSLNGSSSLAGREEQYSLLEKFAARVAEVVLATPSVAAVTVNVRKLRPPVAQHLATSGVRIHRTKS